MDKKDARILGMLKENARRSNTGIADVLGISETAVRKRIAKLVREGAIRKFTVEVGEAAGVRAFIFVSVREGVKMGKVAERLLRVRGVENVSEIAGEHDICAQVSAESHKEVNRAVDEMRKIKGVRSTRTFMVLKQHSR